MFFVPARHLCRLSEDVPGHSQDKYVDTFYLFVGQTFDVSSHDVWFLGGYKYNVQGHAYSSMYPRTHMRRATMAVRLRIVPPTPAVF